MKILDELNIKTNNLDLYETAFTHTSYANEHNKESYERLEYLGDAVLELIISEYLYKYTNHAEGIMTKLRAHYVCENALYEYSLKLKLNISSITSGYFTFIQNPPDTLNACFKNTINPWNE